MKMHFQNPQPRVINYGNYKNFQNKKFLEDLLFELSKSNIRNNNDDFIGFLDTRMKTLNQHAL